MQIFIYATKQFDLSNTETTDKDLHWKILVGISLGIFVSFSLHDIQGGAEWAQAYIKPFGTIFIRLLQLMAIPLLLTSLITGIAGMRSLDHLGKLGGRTLLLFTFTCVTATTIGVVLASIIQPGSFVPADLRQELFTSYSSDVSQFVDAKNNQPLGFFQMLVQWVPSNIFYALGQNSMMLSIVLFSILFGIAACQVPSYQTKPVIDFLEGLQEIFMKMVLLIMKIAPFGVFALIASISLNWSLLTSLFIYIITVVLGLSVILFILYPAVFTLIGKTGYRFFFQMMQPAFLTAFSTSSSAATLPVTMNRVTEGLKVKKEPAHFILSLGTTINMDGTALYQAVAAIFMAQVVGIDLSWLDMLTIIVTCTLAAVGAAGVPGAGMITLMIVLQSVHVPVEAIALIMAPDRLLDMFRSLVNVAGDATAAVALGEKEVE